MLQNENSPTPPNPTNSPGADPMNSKEEQNDFEHLSYSSKPYFTEVQLIGTPYERGFQHGTQFSALIKETYHDYRQLIASLSDTEITNYLNQLQTYTEQFEPDIANEISGIAHGASLPESYIYSINARTELLLLSEGLDVNECTAFYNKPSRILAQNWDFIQEFSERVFVMTAIDPERSLSYVSITEPGMLAKIGCNNFGIGVCLNFVKSIVSLPRFPVHFALRKFLEARSLEQARNLFSGITPGTSSSIIIGDSSGEALCFELRGERPSLILPPTGQNLCHTNHFIGDTPKPENENSFQRLLQLQTLAESIQSEISANKAHFLLRDSEHDTHPLYRPYIPHHFQRNVGTVATIVMDLGKRVFYYSKGHAEEQLRGVELPDMGKPLAP